MASLAIRKLRTKVSLGCKQEERAYPRISEIDIVVHYDMREAIGSDSVAFGVDYNELSVAIEQMCLGREWKLLETFAADVAHRALDLTERIREVEVTVRRNVMVAAEAVEVTLRMDREGKVR